MHNYTWNQCLCTIWGRPNILVLIVNTALVSMLPREAMETLPGPPVLSCLMERKSIPLPTGLFRESCEPWWPISVKWAEQEEDWTRSTWKHLQQQAAHGRVVMGGDTWLRDREFKSLCWQIPPRWKTLHIDLLMLLNLCHKTHNQWYCDSALWSIITRIDCIQVQPCTITYKIR